jgi:CBS domain-containing protein
MPVDLREGRVRDLMDHHPGRTAVVRKGEPLHAVVKAIAESPSTSTVYVVDEDGRLLGQIGVRVLIRQLANRLGVGGKGARSLLTYVRDMLKGNVEEFMSPSASVQGDEEIVEAIRKMVASGQTDVPVVDDRERVVGELNGTEILSRAGRFLKDGDPGPGAPDADQR